MNPPLPPTTPSNPARHSSGIPDAVAMALVGHESAAISQRYTHVSKKALTQATELAA